MAVVLGVRCSFALGGGYFVSVLAGGSWIQVGLVTGGWI